MWWALAAASTMSPTDPAGQLAAGDFQLVGGGEVEAELDAQALGKVGEATGQDGGTQAGVLAGFEQFAGAGREEQALAENTGQHAGIQPGKQRQAAAQAFAVVDFAPHGGFGHCRDLFLLAGEVGQLVDALDGDQRRIHVEADQAEIGELLAGLGEGPVELLGFDERDQRIEFGRAAGFFEADDLRRARLDGGGAGCGNDAFKQEGGQGAALDDEVHGSSAWFIPLPDGLALRRVMPPRPRLVAFHEAGD